MKAESPILLLVISTMSQNWTCLTVIWTPFFYCSSTIATRRLCSQSFGQAFGWHVVCRILPSAFLGGSFQLRALSLTSFVPFWYFMEVCVIHFFTGPAAAPYDFANNMLPERQSWDCSTAKDTVQNLNQGFDVLDPLWLHEPIIPDPIAGMGEHSAPSAFKEKMGQTSYSSATECVIPTKS